MAPVGDVPYLTGYVVTIRSCHAYFDVFDSKKFNIALIFRVFLSVSRFISVG